MPPASVIAPSLRRKHWSTPPVAATNRLLRPRAKARLHTARAPLLHRAVSTACQPALDITQRLTLAHSGAWLHRRRHIGQHDAAPVRRAPAHLAPAQHRCRTLTATHSAPAGEALQIIKCCAIPIEKPKPAADADTGFDAFLLPPLRYLSYHLRASKTSEVGAVSAACRRRAAAKRFPLPPRGW